MPTGVYKRTEETKKKMGVAAKIRGNHRSGISHSEKSKRKMSKSHRGETKVKQSIQGQKPSELERRDYSYTNKN